ncbi:MAG: 50S ribosomal protein L29 [Bdellovibrionales bacterium]|jgi:large subunit ribosomal protein L29|nr:50S ribosomal protein L29 [Bdellovibrionales bacterium]
MLEFKEIEGWETDAIQAKVTELRAELFTTKMQGGVSSVEKPHLIKEYKKDIARLLTVLNAKGDK